MANQPVPQTADISIHALRKESDRRGDCCLWGYVVFQSTLSVRRATTDAWVKAALNKFQSPLSVRRATCCGSDGRNGTSISIHALRKESDS